MLKTLIMKATFIALVGSVSFVAHAIADTQRIDAPAGGLVAALETLAKQADVDIVYQDEQLKGLQTAGVSGDLSPRDAVMKLLEGTPLQLRMDEASGAMLITPLPSGGRDSPSSSSAEVSAETSGVLTEKRSFWDRFRLARADTASERSENPNSSETQSTESDKKLGTSSDVSNNKVIDEVVVTAQKREERLQDVPISMSVLGGVELDKSSVAELREALSRVPGVSVQDVGGGVAQQVAIRGVAAAGGAFNGSSAAAYYLDSVPFGFVKSANAPGIGPYDLDRIEVLRGPQGTLYGASALNGVVRVLTKDPSLDGFDFKARLGASHISKYSSGMNYRADAAVNIPIIEDKLAARATISYQDWSGWIDRLDRLPLLPPSGDKKDANDAQLSTMRLKVRARPTDELTIDASVWLDRADYGGLAIGTQSHTRSSAVPESTSQDYSAYNFKIGYDFPAFTITSATSYLDADTPWVLDAGPRDLRAFWTATNFAQEVNVVSTHEGRLRWSLGGLYRDATEALVQLNTFYASGVSSVATDRLSGSESFALFGELTYALIEDRLELTGGLRYFEDTQTFAGGATSFDISVPGVSADFKKWTPRLVLNWRPGDQLMLYASYGQGYRSGAHQNPGVFVAAAQIGAAIPPADPDTLTNYEIGAKGGLFDGLVEFDAALYYVDWKDSQQNISLILLNAQGNPIGINALANAGSISGIGVDAGLIVKPVEGLELGGNLSWNGLKADVDVLAVTGLLFAKGDRPAFSPEWTLSGSASYSFPLGGSGFMGRLSGSANYTSAYAARRVIQGVSQIVSSEPVTLARASFTVDAPEHWSFSVYAENITNESGTQAIAPPDVLDASQAFRPRPRMIGVQLEHKF